ncbi:biliverdin-producing heme oxygenase [Martelella sp. FOR1707]
MELLAELRNNTSDLHERLDRAVSRTPFASPQGYQRFLLMHARVLPEAERWLAAQPLYATLPGDRLRTAALARDLDALALSMPAGDCVADNSSSVAGLAYVLEGSRLGARYLLGQLAKAGAPYPVAFLRHGEGEDHWKTFRVWLSAQPATQSAVATAVTSARALFDAYLEAVCHLEGEQAQ